ncbi:uncharacterized protein [Drosophila bipectinata]|uniref:uncharacterized protein n=1 Tax=Drosophila bipectinata TaxID=42026 RepID=UPI001C88E7B9|nr:uncharacterized protein LOC108126957 [Drosophila bipectinata]
MDRKKENGNSRREILNLSLDDYYKLHVAPRLASTPGCGPYMRQRRHNHRSQFYGNQYLEQRPFRYPGHPNPLADPTNVDEQLRRLRNALSTSDSTPSLNKDDTLAAGGSGGSKTSTAVSVIDLTGWNGDMEGNGFRYPGHPNPPASKQPANAYGELKGLGTVRSAFEVNGASGSTSTAETTSAVTLATGDSGGSKTGTAVSVVDLTGWNGDMEGSGSRDTGRPNSPSSMQLAKAYDLLKILRNALRTSDL